MLSENNEVENPTEWTVNLDYETNYKPQFVINHYNQAFEIFTQDIENNIYLINDNGALLWKKKIGNAILGDIHQIDRYKNTKLQYLFNTKDDSKTNLKKTIEKIDTMNNITFIPRS